MQKAIIALFFVVGYVCTAMPYHQPTKKEVARAVDVVRADGRCPAGVQFISVGPADPLKRAAGEADGTALIGLVLRDRKSRHVYEVFAEAESGRVTEWRRVDDVQPMLTFDDFDSASVIVRAHEGWRRSIERRGLSTDDVVLDGWASGIPSSSNPQRIVRVLTYQRSAKNNLYYDRPIEGLVCTVNLDAHRVIEFHDKPVAPVPQSSGDFGEVYKEHPLYQAPFSIKQNAKKAVKIRGSEIKWMGWRFNVLLHARDGLVVHNARFDDRGVQRKVLHRLGLSEMVVPYGDTSVYWYWRAAFDVGEYGVGNLTSPLKPGLDLPTNAQTIPAVFAGPMGDPLEIPNAIGVYERDAGIMWKHADPFTGDNRVRRARELVVMSITTVGNYDYSLSYVFSMDGTITVEVGLTGILLPKGTVDTVVRYSGESGQKYGALVAKNVLAPNHQHFFNFRVDLDVDGQNNTVSEMEMWSPPREENRYGNAIVMDDYEWLYEGESRSDVNMKSARTWKISSTTTTNALGGRPSYMLVPGANATPFLIPEHFLWKRASFLKHHVWVTRFHDNEMYAAGAYPNQSSGGDGVEHYASNNESLRGKDVVLWYTLGITHHPRPEEWPVMNTHHASFKLVPTGFFDVNPALYLKP
ncbi:MAG: hypothetical protein J5I53_03180 [Bradyrhizobiaceae bacterium]|nr:hypothetical protein [Bradyrhizobiaceae bacterium]